MIIVTLILQCLLIIAFLFAGLSKLAGAKMQVESFKHLGLPQWFRVVTGIVALIGVAGLVIGFWNEGALFFAGLWISCMMLGAVLSHIRVKDSFSQMVGAILLLTLALVLTFLMYSTM
ncbi:DoxX family protein [Paenibacillus sp. GSMTC-2017]|uniref:DoxX family protein n=1 Tax=Paenibacillus sp. GSMTC-2017 TaxID=2794350 RepID=UPI0018D7230E|nr:DoxX family protein [Paenibacillus sp. GSMTC-2017]MBH5319542.1 DoxX family protein [Paenibacillus sp. GSMTC-2017]